MRRSLTDVQICVLVLPFRFLEKIPSESERDIAARLDVSSTTASEAKRLLAELGIITKHGGLYYVAGDLC